MYPTPMWCALRKWTIRCEHDFSHEVSLVIELDVLLMFNKYKSNNRDFTLSSQTHCIVCLSPSLVFFHINYCGNCRYP